MTRTKLAAVVGIAGAVLLLAGCQDNDVRKYLGQDGGENGLWAWEKRVQEAICQIEEQDPTGLDPTKRICPQGPIGITPPPSYPPQ